jgi:hypothetical protein
MGRGELLFWMSSFAPKDITIRVIGDQDKVATKLMRFPDAWINWERCAGNGGIAVETDVWRKNVGPFCQDNIKKVFVQSTVDILSGAGDMACLDKLTDRWGRQGDAVCLTDGRKVNQVDVTVRDTRYYDNRQQTREQTFLFSDIISIIAYTVSVVYM